MKLTIKRMDNYFNKPTQKDYIKKPVAIHTEDTFYQICKQYIPNSIKQTANIAPILQSKKSTAITTKNIFDFVKTYIKYREDKKGFEEIKLPTKLWQDKKGDCEDFTIFCSSILCNLRVNHIIRMADYGKGWQHIYVVVGKTVLDPVQDTFNYEDKGKFLDFKFNFEGLGATGIKYNPRLTSSEVTKLVKEEIQAKYPQAELSVSKSRYSGGWSLRVEIKDCGFNPYEDGYDGWESNWYEKHPNRKSIFNEKAQALIKSCKVIIADYNYDNSDVSTDYFDVGFYSTVELVEWSHLLLYLKESKMADFYKRNNPEYVNWAIKRISTKDKPQNWKMYLLKFEEQLKKI